MLSFVTTEDIHIRERIQFYLTIFDGKVTVIVVNSALSLKFVWKATLYLYDTRLGLLRDYA